MTEAREPAPAAALASTEVEPQRDGDRPARGMNAAVMAGGGGVGGMPVNHHKPKGSLKLVLVALVLAAAGTIAAIVTVHYVVGGPDAFAGTVEVPERVDLNFQVSGQLAVVEVHAGDTVHAGQVLATLDQTAAAAQVQADQSVVDADQAVVAQLQNPVVGPAQVNQEGLQVSQAQTAVTNAMHSLSDARALATSMLNQAEATLAGKQTAVAADQQHLAVSCSTPAPSPLGAVVTTLPPQAQFDITSTCQSLESQLANDQAAVQQAQTDLTHTVVTGQQSVDAGNAALASSQAALALAKNQPAVAGAPGTPSAISQAQATLVQAKAQLAAAQTSLAQLTVVAPRDGLIAEVSGVPGDAVSNAGVRRYASLPSTATNSPSFSLFPPPAQSTSQTNQADLYLPLMTLVPSGAMDALVEVPESTIGRIHPGQAAHVTFNAISVTVSATVLRVVPIPLAGTSSPTYDVALRMARVPAGVLPGMSVSARITT